MIGNVSNANSLLKSFKLESMFGKPKNKYYIYGVHLSCYIKLIRFRCKIINLNHSIFIIDQFSHESRTRSSNAHKRMKLQLE